MDKKLMALLVVPLFLLIVPCILLNSIFPFDGFFINLTTEIFGIILTVLYVDWMLRRHEETKWKNVNIRVSEQILILVNTTLSSVRTACKYSVEDIVGINRMYKLSRLGINGVAKELIEGTEKIIEPNILSQVINFDKDTWSTLATNSANVHNACINYLSMFGNLMKPQQYELVLDLQNQSFKVFENFRTFGDIITESDEDIIKKYGDDEKIELRNELIQSSGRDLLKLIGFAKELGKYQISLKLDE